MTDYKIEGYGKTTREADRVLKKNCDDLVSKFKSARISTDITVARSFYKGRYDLKGVCKAKACETHFEVESKEGWDAIGEKAATHSGLKNYNTIFSVEQYLALTQDQQKALKPKRPPAGPMDTDRAYSSLDLIGKLN